MLVLRKRQIALATMCVFLSIFTFMFTTADKETKENTLETVSLPVSRENNNFGCRASEFQMRGHKVVMEQQKQHQI